MIRHVLAFAIMIGAAMPGDARAQDAASTPSRPTAIDDMPAPTGRTLVVTTPGWKAGGAFDRRYTQYGANVFPGLRWSRGPRGTRSYAVVMQDPDSRSGVALHWTLLNVPASVLHLAPGMAPSDPPRGSSYGPNARGPAQPYLGPHPGPGPAHRYHLAVFALDRRVEAAAALDYAALRRQMARHVLAAGEVIGLATAPDPPS